MGLTDVFSPLYLRVSMHRHNLDMRDSLAQRRCPMSAKRRGFASMDPEKQREIARKGGRAAHEKGTAHRWDSDEARIAGRKGGEASHGGGRKKATER